MYSREDDCAPEQETQPGVTSPEQLSGSRLLPAIITTAVVLLFAACVASKLNGSSIGQWQQFLAEPHPVRGLLLSTPKKVRSDEWVVWTPSVLSQARQTPPFPIENSDLGYGRAPLLMSVPVAYYTMLFRPQLWGFFVFDLERAFSFYWCAKVFGLLLAPIWLLRQIGIRDRAVVLFGAVLIFFSSYVQWWFSSPAMLPEMIASWAMCVGCVIALWRETAWRKLIAATAGLIFFGVNFALCAYPPFQIPLLYLAAALLAGFWWENRDARERLHTRRGLILLGAAVAAMAVALVPFYVDVRATLAVIADTEYPGQRRSTGGGYSLLKYFSGLIGFFESEDKVPPGFPNICEASNFYPFWIFAVGGMLVGRVRHRIPIAPTALLLTLLLVTLSLFCLFPLPPLFNRISLLDRAHEARVLLVIGLANILLVCIFLDRYRQQVFSFFSGIAGGLITATGIAAYFYAVHVNAPQFFAGWSHLLLLLLPNAVVVGMFFWSKGRRWLPLVFGSLLICSTALINPVMRGLGPLVGSAAFQEVERIHRVDPQSKWVVYDDYVFAQLVKAAGAQVFNGTKVIPDLELLRQLDPERHSEAVYNRYAWIICVPQVFPEVVSFSLLQPEFYRVTLPPGLPFLREGNYNYYVFPGNWRDAVFYDFDLVSKVPPDRFWFYGRDLSARAGR